MTSADKTILAAITIFSFALIVIGGLFNPNTLAGSFAKFIFSCN